MNTIEYIPNIERLILDLLADNRNNGEVCLSKSLLLQVLKMTNENYKYGKYNTSQLSNYMKIDELNIQEFYERSMEMLKGNIEKSLNRLQSESWIRWNLVRMICYSEAATKKNSQGNIQVNIYYEKNEYGEKELKPRSENATSEKVMEATSEEDEYIRFTERKVMNQMGFDNRAKIIRAGKWYEFLSIVSDIISEEKNIMFYYDSYKIRSNPNQIKDRIIKLDESEREREQMALNNGVITRVKENTHRRHISAMKTIAENPFEVDEKINRRISSEYLIDHANLIDMLMDITRPIIIHEVRKAYINR